MNPSIITYQEDFLELCDHIKQCGIVSFDSEFILGVGKAERRVIFLLDIDRVLSVSERVAVVTAAA